MINLVLFEPEIPPNTGNIIRLSANTGFQLHLIKPFGFELDDKRLRRAGLDYHEFAGVIIHDNWQGFLESVESTANSGIVYGISTKGTASYAQVQYKEGDYVVFGPETRGLPDNIRDQLPQQHLLRLPMTAGSRSLNLSNAAAVVAYEAWRQLGFIDGN